MFVLHCVFLRRITHALECFRQAWNHHPLRTEKMWSLNRIWVNGMLRQGGGDDVTASIPQGLLDLENYGVEPDGPVPQVH